MEGREPVEVKAFRRDMLETNKRIADALEKLASDPQIEVEFGLPLCPNCGALDPEVMTVAEEATATRLSHIIIHAVCGQCNEIIFGVAESYSMHANSQTLREVIEGRERAGWLNGRT